jgi:DNA-binding transcriptional regulator YdaS (Cro superfamily)
MVRGATKYPEEKMSMPAKVVFGIIIASTLFGLVFAYLATTTSNQTNAAFARTDCRARYTQAISEAEAESDVAYNQIRRAQFLGQYYGLATENDVEFKKSVEAGFEGLKFQHLAEHNLEWYSKEYETLIYWQKEDRDKFDELCKEGPTPAPDPPPYVEPPRK